MYPFLYYFFKNLIKNKIKKFALYKPFEIN